MLKEKIDCHINAIREALLGEEDCIEGAFRILSHARGKGARVLILGNGGSMAIAQHFAQDLLKLCGVKAWTINCPSIITAHANDDGFDYSFFNPAVKLLDSGDPIFIFSCSGKSRNYIEFVSGFPDAKNPIVSIVGTDGGFLKEKSNVSIHIKSDDYQVCETAFCVVSDMLIKLLEEAQNGDC